MITSGAAINNLGAETVAPVWPRRWRIRWTSLRCSQIKRRIPSFSGMVLQSTNQFFLFPLLWTTQYTARSTTSPTYKYSTCTRTSCPACTILTACPTCLQPIPYRPPSSIQCHRLLRTTPRLCPATAASGKPTSPTSATLRCRDVQPHPCLMNLGVPGEGTADTRK